MTYNEWRDELKNNLLSVPDSERQRVLDYYAEAYADRREAGFSEKEIIAEFGAPYDAAQRILHESDGPCGEPPKKGNDIYGQTSSQKRNDIYGQSSNQKRNDIYGQSSNQRDIYGQSADPSPAPAGQPAPATGKKKKIIWITIVCVIAGILLLAVTFWGILFAVGSAVDPEFTEEHYSQQAESIQTVKIDFSVGEVETVFYDGDKIEIDYHTSNIYNVEVYERGGTLCYRQQNKWWLMHWGTINCPKTTIKLPQSCVYNLDVDMSAGSTTVNGGNFGEIKVDLSAGAVNLVGNFVCSSLKIDLSAGKVSVGKVECAGTVMIDLSAGTVDIDEAVCNKMTIDLSAGTVDIDTLNCPKIDIDLSAGTVKLGIVGQQAEYTIQVDKSAGKCNLSNQKGTDNDKLIDIDLSAGTVNVTFKA